MKLKERVIVITGSTRGIGRAIAEACAKEGACVVVNSREESAVKQTCEIFRAYGLSVSGIAADVSNQEDLEKLLQHSIETWGRVDVWINNAGLSGGFRPLDKMSVDEIEAIINANLLGTLKACRMIIPYFIENGSGIVLNMSGKGGHLNPSPFTSTYASTKAAVVSLTKSLAKEYKDYPISIHAVSPGMVETDFYSNIKTSPELIASINSLPYIFKSIGVPTRAVGDFFVRIAAQKPGNKTGNVYSILKGWRLLRGMGLLIYYRASKKIVGPG